MKRILLAGNEKIAKDWCEDNGVKFSAKDTIYAAGPASLQGMALSDEDVIVHLPHFGDRKNAQKILDTLTINARKNAARPTELRP